MEEGPPTPAPAQPAASPTSFKSIWPQCAAAAVVLLLRISFHLASYLQIDMYHNVLNWPHLEGIGSLYLSSIIAEVLSYPIFVFLFEKLNRKFCGCITSVLIIITCILYKTANSLFLAHVATCFWVIARTGTLFTFTVYVSEIAQDNIRGSLLLGIELLITAFNFAIYLKLIFIGTITFSWFVLVPPMIVTLCFLFWLPETPIYFLQRGNRDGATRSLLWLQRNNTTENVGQQVINLEVLRATWSETTYFSNIFHHPFNRRTVQYSAIAFVLYLIEQFPGEYQTLRIVSALAETLGEHSPNIFGTVAFAIFLTGVFLAFLVCDKKGRRTLLLSSTVGCSVCLIPIAICSHVWSPSNEVAKFFALAMALAITFFLGLGIRAVITVVQTDLFPPKILLIHLLIRGLLTLLFEFLGLKYILPRPSELERHPALFWTSGALCGCSALIIFKYLPETMKRPAGFVFMEKRNEMNHGNM